MDFFMEQNEENDVIVVTCKGYLTYENSSILDDCIKNLIKSKKQKVVFRLGDVKVITSAGWGLFVSYVRKFEDNSGFLRLAEMNNESVEVYKLLNLDMIIPHYKSIEDAITARHN